MKQITPERCEFRALESLSRGDPQLAESYARRLVDLQPENATGWSALWGALMAQERPADAQALAALAAGAGPGVQTIIDRVAGRRLSKRGFLFDPAERFRLAPMAEALEEVPTSRRLRDGANVVWFEDRGGELVERWPVLELGGAAGPGFPVSYRTAPKFVASIRNAAVVGEGLVLTEAGDFIAELTPGKPAKYKAQWAGDGIEFPEWAKDTGQLKVKIFDTPAFLMAGPTDSSFGDFLVNFANRLAQYEAAGLDCPILLRWEPLPQVLPLLEALGVGPDRLIFHATGQVSLFPKLYASCWPSQNKQAPVAGVFDIYRRAARPAGAERPLIYLDRRATRKRPMVNEDEVCELFASRGFRMVNPGALSFDEVREVLASPACVAGGFGSAFHNLVFTNAHPPSLVLMPSHRPFNLREFAQWQADCGNRFAYIDGDMHSEPYLPRTPWSVPLGKVERALDRMMELVAAEAG